MATKKPAPKFEPTAEAAAPLTPQAQDKVEEFVETIKEGTEQMATNAEHPGFAGLGVDKLQSAFGDMNGRAKAAVEKSSKLMEELTELTKGNVEAIVASSRIAAKGAETLGQEAAEYSRRSFENVSATMKSFAEVKSPTDFLKLQSDYMRSAFDSWVAESSKASETVVKLAGEIAEPITSRYSVAAERVKSAVAF